MWCRAAVPEHWKRFTAVLLVLYGGGCDRLRSATVNGSSSLDHATTCGSLRLTADRFAGRHYYLEIRNASSSSIQFRLPRLIAQQNDRFLEYRVLRSGQQVRTDILTLLPGDQFSYDIISGEGEVLVQGPELFSSDGTWCSLGPLSLLAPP